MFAHRVRATSLLIAAVALVASGAPARADSCGYTGSSHPVLASNFHSIGLTLCSTHFPVGSAQYEAVQYALDRLNAVQDSDLYFYIAGTASHRDYDHTLAKDGKNRIDMGSPGCSGTDCSYSGRTQTFANNAGNIDEFDIHFNDEVTWAYGQPTSWELDDGNTYFRTDLLHELGHGMGFDHSKSTTSALSIMGSKTGKWMQNKKVNIKAYDHGHMRYHYSDGNINGRPDLVLGNYRTEQNANGGWDCELTEALSRTTASAGDEVTVRWTRFNTGPKAPGNDYYSRIYLSADDEVSSDDTVVETFRVTDAPAANSMDYGTKTFTVPAIAKGTYRVIVVADVYDDIGEGAEDNNDLVLHEHLTIN